MRRRAIRRERGAFDHLIEREAKGAGREAQSERCERETNGGRERWRFKKAAAIDVGQPVGHPAKCSRGDCGRGSAKASHTHPVPRETDTRAPAQRAWATWTVRLSTTLANCSFAEAGGTSVR